MTESKSKKPGDLMMFDVSSFKHESYGGAKHWLAIVDDHSSMCWSRVLKRKSDVPKAMLEFIRDLEVKHKIKVKKLRCNNAGENIKTDELLRSNGLGIEFEYTAAGTPQQNGKVERKIATIIGKLRSMLSAAGIKDKSRHKIWGEGISTATRLEGILTSGNEKSPCEMFFGRLPKFVKHLRTFGEIGVTARLDRKMSGKLNDKGNVCMMVGYAVNHAGDVYRMLNLKTKKICLSRDVTWLGKTYGDYYKVKDEVEVETIKEEEEEEKEESKDAEQDDKKDGGESGTSDDLEIESNEGYGSVRDRLDGVRKLRSGRELGNVAKVVTWADFAKANLALMTSSVGEDIDEPKTFQEAWWHKDLEAREKWRAAIRKEFHDMIRRGVWRKRSRAGVQDGRTTVKCKWVFKIKRN